jgi:dihydrofolate synthase/folylpolyglutamate synthase
LLGDNVADIAKQKAGITGCCSRVIALRQTAEINGIFKSAAGRSKINIEFIEPSGDYQKDNLALARQACETVAERDGWKLSRPVASAAFKAFRLPGRFETRAVNGKTVVLDGAHNPQKITNLVERLQKQFPDKKFVTLLSTGKERDITELMSLLAPITSQFVLTRYRTLAEHNRKASHNLQGLKLSRFVYEIIDDLPSAVKRLVDSTEDYLVTGSFYLVGEVGPLLP